MNTIQKSRSYKIIDLIIGKQNISQYFSSNEWTDINALSIRGHSQEAITIQCSMVMNNTSMKTKYQLNLIYFKAPLLIDRNTDICS